MSDLPPLDLDALLDHFDLDEAQYQAVLSSPTFVAALEQFGGRVFPLVQPYLEAGVDLGSAALGGTPVGPIAAPVTAVGGHMLIALLGKWLASKGGA